MQVFRIETNISYSGGSALVAARDVQEAIKEYCEDSFRSYIYDYCKCTCNLVFGLDYDTKVPHVIFDDIYVE